MSPIVGKLFECISQEERLVYKKLNSATPLIQRHQGGSPMQTMYYIGLDVHKKTISNGVKDRGEPSGILVARSSEAGIRHHSLCFCVVISQSAEKMSGSVYKDVVVVKRQWSI
jgi:hypothetical protein